MLNKSLIVLALLSASAWAGETVTETPGPVILYRPDGTSQTFKTLAECKAAAPVAAAPGADSRCSVVTNIKKVGACDAATEPDLPSEVQVEEPAHQCPNDPNRWFNRVEGWKRDPYPSCKWQLKMLPEEANPAFCTALIVRDDTMLPGEELAELAPIEPGYDEHDPIGPTDDGTPGAPTVDKPGA